MLTAFLLVIGLIAVLGACVALTVARQRVKTHGLPLLAWRYLCGQPHHGHALTDAGWSRRGTKALTPTGHVGRFWYLPQRARIARRAVRAAVAFLAACAYLSGGWPVFLTLALAAAAAAAYWSYRGIRWQRQRKHHRTWLYPAHLTAAPLAGIPLSAAPSEWLAIEPDRSRVTAELPPEFNADDKGRQRLAETLAGKLGIEAPEVRWALAGPKPRLEIARSQPPPAMVRLADVRPAYEAARPDDVVWGPGRKGKIVTTSLSGDSPHVGLSMGSGAGKSELAKWILAQQLHRGAVGLVLDHKMMSHLWVRGLPNVATALRPKDIHKALVWLGGEVQRRKEVAFHGADMDGRVHAIVGPRIIVIGEELNATVEQLRAYWREVRAKDDAVRSPALTALDEVSFTGRSVLVNLVYIGQRLSNKATGGGGDARENIGVIAFARYRPSTWKMLAPDFAMPPKDNHPGRIQVVSDQVRTAQAPLLSAAEARELALSGVVSALPHDMPGAARATAETASPEFTETGAGLAVATVSPPLATAPVSAAVTLREAVQAGILGPLTLAGARTARHRDETFPRRVGRDGVAELYDPAALAGWAAQRKE